MLEGLRQLFQGWQIHVMSDNDKSTYPKINFDTVNNCDLFVLGGGELINTTHLFFALPQHLHLIPDSWVQKIEIPKIILGCGVNAENVNQLKPHVIKDLEKFSYIGLRDTTSVKILNSIPKLKGKVDLFYDTSFAIDTNGLSWQHTKDMAIVMPTDRYTDRSDRGIREFNVAIKSQVWLKHKLAPYAKTVFLPFGQEDNDDFETCKTLLSCANNGEILPPNQVTLPKVLNLISECACVFPYRLHGLILSFMLGAKYEFYPYHRKLNRMHETLTGCNPEAIRIKQRKRFNEIVEAATSLTAIVGGSCKR